MKKSEITQKEIREWCTYNPITGIVRAKQNSKGVLAGERLGTLNNDGYLKTVYKGVQIQLHQLAFLYMEGFIPEIIDHRDRDRKNNAWDNLREATHEDNNRNRKLLPSNKTGVAGVKYRPKTDNYEVDIRTGKGNPRLYLGRYPTKLEAIIARYNAEIKHWGFSNINLEDWI
ncbi:AP2 domain-containing protein [Vibrio phage D4]|nr:AP2 domain-containing protein [Vibrio phage D4]